MTAEHALAWAVLAARRGQRGPVGRGGTEGGASPEFRAWWQEYPVNEFRPAAIGLPHPGAGNLDLQLHQLRMVEHPDLLLVLQLPATGQDRSRIAATVDRARPAPRSGRPRTCAGTRCSPAPQPRQARGETPADSRAPPRRALPGPLPPHKITDPAP